MFDLDGTLTNPFKGITDGILYALKNLGYDCPPAEELKSFIGPPIFDEFSRRFGMDEATAKKAVRLYREYYSAGGLYENELLDGAEELLSELHRMSRKICLASSKPEIFCRKILAHFGIDGYFDFISGATIDGSIGTKTEVVKLVLDKTGSVPEKSVLVGDRFHDIVGAHEMGVKCIAVLVGFGSREEFAEYGADFVAETLSDVAKLV
jgi:phosphoglycolate phosphatase